MEHEKNLYSASLNSAFILVEIPGYGRESGSGIYYEIFMTTASLKADLAAMSGNTGIV